MDTSTATTRERAARVGEGRALAPTVALFGAITLALGGCRVVGDIFKAGVWVGVVAVVVVLALIGGVGALARRR